MSGQLGALGSAACTPGLACKKLAAIWDNKAAGCAAGDRKPLDMAFTLCSAACPAIAAVLLLHFSQSERAYATSLSNVTKQLLSKALAHQA